MSARRSAAGGGARPRRVVKRAKNDYDRTADSPRASHLVRPAPQHNDMREVELDDAPTDALLDRDTYLREQRPPHYGA